LLFIFKPYHPSSPVAEQRPITVHLQILLLFTGKSGCCSSFSILLLFFVLLFHLQTQLLSFPNLVAVHLQLLLFNIKSC
jgi:hypothetical protein